MQQLLDREVVVITANHFLAQQLKQWVVRASTNSERPVLDQPSIYSWSDWLRECYRLLCQHSATDIACVLSPLQTKLLWEKSIREASRDHDPLMSVSNLARSMASAQVLAAEWQFDIKDIPAHYSDNIAMLRSSARLFAQHCDRDSVQTLDQLPSLLLESLDDWLPHQLCRQWFWLGFNQRTPSQQLFYDQTREAGIRHQELDRGVEPETISRHQFCSEDDELIAATRWLHQRAQQYSGDGCFLAVPRLHQRRRHIERILFRELHSRTGLVAAPAQRLFSIRSPQSLIESESVKHAFAWLRLATTGLSEVEISDWLLSSSGVGAESGLQSRAKLDSWLRETGANRISIKGLLKRIAGLSQSTTHQSIQQAAEELGLVERLQQLVMVIDGIANRQSPFEWTQVFSDCLESVGWPYESLDQPTVYQSYQNWLSLLTQFSSTGMVLSSLTIRQAYRQLESLARETQVYEKISGAVLSVIDINDVPGLYVDHLWITGLDNQQWPEFVECDHLLPYLWQRKLAMPGTDPAAEQERVLHRQQKILHSARHLVLSYSEQLDQQGRKPALLIGEHKLDPVPESLLEAQQSEQVSLEVVTDQNGPPLLESESLLHGVSPLADQAACPFRAFVHHRLHSQEVSDWQYAHSAATRGTLIHRVMQRLWQQLKTQQALLALDELEIRELINGYVGEAMAELPYVGDRTFWQQFVELEQKRIANLVEQWLQQERGRAPFTVELIEHAELLRFNGLKITLRLDRADRLQDGTCFVIDYKTSSTLSVNDWLQQRPEAVQLLLYLLTLTDVSAIAYAKMRDGDSRWLGLADDNVEGLEPDPERANQRQIKPISSCKPELQDWQTWRKQWRHEIEQLVCEYQSGDARVDPKPKACIYCELGPVCRIDLNRSSSVGPNQ